MSTQETTTNKIITNKITVLICDDEPLARERMRVLLARIDDVHVLKAEARDGAEALALIQHHLPDVVLLDIQMPGMDGLVCAGHIARLDTPPAVIFCTAYDEHALDAFQAEAIAYLLKPVRQTQLEEALQRAQRLSRSQLSALQSREIETNDQNHISAKTHKGIELIPVKDISLFHADQKYVSVCYSEGEVLIDEPLKSLEERLGDDFIRIHRNALVAQKSIEGLIRNKQGSYELQVKHREQPIAVSRRQVSLVRRLLSGRL